MWVARRDFERLQEFGQVYMPDYVPVPSEYVVLDYNPTTLEARPVGLVDSTHPERPEGLGYVLRQLQGRGRIRRKNDLFRPADLMTIKDIARRTSRSEMTVRAWAQQPTFPEPVLIVSRGSYSTPMRYFSYPEVKRWMRTEGLSIRVKYVPKRKSHAYRRRRKGSNQRGTR